MNRAALDAAHRLLSATPPESVRKHEWLPPYYAHKAHPKESPDDGRHGHNRRPVKFEGKTYHSMTDLRRRFSVSIRTVHRWLDDGRAVYVEKKQRRRK